MKLNRLKQHFHSLLVALPKNDDRQNRGIPLKMLLLVPFLLQIFIIVGLVGSFSFDNGQQAVSKIADRLRSKMSDGIGHSLKDILKDPKQLTVLTTQSTEVSSFDFDDSNLVKQKFLQKAMTFDIAQIHFASTDGKFFQLSRELDGSFIWDTSEDSQHLDRIHRYALKENGTIDRLLKTYSYDPRYSSWYKDATSPDNMRRVTSSILVNEDNPQDLYLSISAPLYRQGQLIGTIGTSKSLQQLSEYLQNNNQTESGTIFIIERSGYLVASSDGEKLTQINSDKTYRIAAINSQNDRIRETSKFLQSQFFDFHQIKSPQKLQFNFNNERHFVEVRPWQDETGLDCLIVITIPANEFMEDLMAARSVTVAICFLALGIATVITVLTSELITSPIHRLSKLSSSIATNKNMIGVEDRLELQSQSDNIREVRLLSHSFHNMIIQLQEAIEGLEIKVEERTGELKKAKEVAEIANRSKSDFLTNMSHEVRTPLNAILGFCQLMQRDKSLSKEHQENLGIIIRSGDHLLSLINDVLDLSKIEAGRSALWETDFDLHGAIHNVIGMLTLRAEAKGLDLWCEIDPNVPQFIHTDERKLRQILINLIGNSIKFTDRGRVILKVKSMEAETISLISDIEVLEFTIEDTGVGIAPEEIDSLFEPFTQSKSGRDSQQGTGLGLSIVRQFVKMMEGDINVTSEVNKGSCFSFHIPVQIGDASQIIVAKDNRKVIGIKPNQVRHRILAVDDRWENRQLLLKLLSEVGFEVKAAENGKEAVEIWESWEPHLIWMDMRMPVMNGYDAVEAIRSHVKGQATVIIALTASTFEEERMLILSAGCDDFVRKPFLERIIFDKISEYLGTEYIYEDLEEIVTVSPTILELSADMLEVMSVDWLQELERAAMELDRETIDKLLEIVPLEHANIKLAIVQHLNNFEFDCLIKYSQEALEGQELKSC